MKIKLLLSLLFTLCVCQIRAQHLPKLSDLGLVQITKVYFSDDFDKSSNEHWLDLVYQDGYVVSGDYYWKSEEKEQSVKMEITSNPVELTYTQKSYSSYYSSVIKNIVFNLDGTISQFTNEIISSSTYQETKSRTYVVYLSYDNDQHLTRFETSDGQYTIENVWKGGNLVKQTKQTDDLIISEISYGEELNPGVEIFHSFYNFPLGVLGFFGRPSKNLPISASVWDSEIGAYEGSISLLFDDQHRIIGTSYIEWGYDDAINNIPILGSDIESQMYGVDGTIQPNSKGLKVVKKPNGESQIVFIK